MSEPQPPGDTAGRADPAAVLRVAHPAAAGLGATVVEVDGRRATMRLEVGPHLVNGHGVCHGGVLFALADLAATLAAGAAGGAGQVAASTGASIELVSPAPLGSLLTARSVEAHARGRSAIYDTTISSSGPDDQAGGVVALVRSRLRLTDVPAPPEAGSSTVGRRTAPPPSSP